MNNREMNKLMSRSFKPATKLYALAAFDGCIW